MTAADQIKYVPPLATMTDAQGHRVDVHETRSGLLVIATQAGPADGRRSGQPCLNRDNAVVLRDALTEFIARCP